MISKEVKKLELNTIYKNIHDYFVYLSVIIIIIINILIFCSIFLSIIPVCFHFYELLYIIRHEPNTTLHEFVRNVSPLIEFALFDTILLILATGIYIIIIIPVIENKKFQLEMTVNSLTKYLSFPFLTMIGSILTVSILHIITLLFLMLQDDKNLYVQDFLLYILLIIGISIAIVAISILIKTEHSSMKNSENSKK